MRFLTVLIAALNWAGVAAAQSRAPEPHGSASVSAEGPLPSAEAMELGRRIARALHQEELSHGVSTLSALAEDEASTSRDAPFATSREGVDWTWALYDRALEQIALLYARRYSTAELRQMADFFRSPAGQRLLSDQSRLSEEIKVLFRSRYLETEYIAIVCRPKEPAGPAADPGGAAATKRPDWCDDPSKADPHIGRSVEKAVERFGPPMKVIDVHGQGRFFSFWLRGTRVMMDRDAEDPSNWTNPRTRLDPLPAYDHGDDRSLPPMSFSPPQAPSPCTLTLVADWDKGRKAWITKKAIRREAEDGGRCLPT